MNFSKKAFMGFIRSISAGILIAGIFLMIFACHHNSKIDSIGVSNTSHDEFTTINYHWTINSNFKVKSAVAQITFYDSYDDVFDIVEIKAYDQYLFYTLHTHESILGVGNKISRHEIELQSVKVNNIKFIVLASVVLAIGILLPFYAKRLTLKK